MRRVHLVALCAWTALSFGAQGLRAQVTAGSAETFLQITTVIDFAPS